MTTPATIDKRILIKLSDAPPVRIIAQDWPVVAVASWASNYPECQANEVACIRVRESEATPTRRIVYGVRGSGNGGMPIGYRGKHAGYLVDSTDDEETIRAIRRVAGVLEMPDLGDECIADLPARDL